MKPGNRAEDKTLRTRKEEKKEDRSSTENPPLATVNTSDPGSEPKPGQPNSRDWDVGGRGRKASVAAKGSRYSVMMVAEARKPEGDAQEASGFQPKGLHITRQSLAMGKSRRQR